jgi:hypothetical protein
MKNIYRISVVFFLFFMFTGVHAQSPTTFPGNIYGLDPLLYNGKYNSYFIPSGTGGTPFFNGPDFLTGYVTIRGVSYDNLWLKYDVFNNQLILQYKTSAGADNQIILSDAWLETFDLGGSHFEMLAIQDSIKRIYQVMGTGPNRILYSWSKSLDLDTRLGAINHVFSASKKETYLLSGSKLLKYKNNRSFVALFEPSKQPALKKFMRQKKTNVKKASDLVMTELINYCNTPAL